MRSLIEDLERLLGIGARALEDFVARRNGTRAAPAGRVADLRREITDDEHHIVPQLLELTHLVEEHRVPEMKVRPRRIEACFDLERLAAVQTLEELRLDVQVDHAALELGELRFGLHP